MTIIYFTIFSISLLLLIQSLFDYKLKKQQLARKLLTSTLFILISLAISYHQATIYLNRYLIIALFFYLLGDGFLVSVSKASFEFSYGIITFIIGHIFMFFYLFKSYNLIPFLISVLIVFITIVISELFDLKIGKYQKLVYPYTFMLALITFKAIFNYLDFKNIANLLQAIGFCLFFLSDFILLFHHFSNHKQSYIKMANLILYYYGIFLIVVSLAY